MIVAGVDGCRAGWVLVATGLADEDEVSLAVLPDGASIVAMVEEGQLSCVAIDIPIGLPDRGPRACDLAARRLIGPRASSVFPAPVRNVLGATSYHEACERSRAACGKSLSRQTFGIVSRIAEIDGLMTPELQDRIVECCPEVCFATLAGHAMEHPKRTAAGRAERLESLRGHFAGLDELGGGRLRGRSPDDVLDAFAVAWSARRWASGTHFRLGGNVDRRGLRMEIVC